MIEKQKSSAPLERAVAGGEYGVQPLDGLMAEHGLANTALVDAASEPLTYKMVNKARRGRRLSRKVQSKVLQAYNQALTRKQGEKAPCLGLKDLFNYDGR